MIKSLKLRNELRQIHTLHHLKGVCVCDNLTSEVAKPDENSERKASKS